MKKNGIIILILVIIATIWMCFTSCVDTYKGCTIYYFRADRHKDYTWEYKQAAIARLKQGDTIYLSEMGNWVTYKTTDLAIIDTIICN